MKNSIAGFSLLISVLCMDSISLAQGSENALDFDGVNDYIRVSHDNSLNALGSFTLSTWIYVNSFNGSYDYPILYKGDEASGGEWYALSVLRNGKVYLRLRTPTENALFSVNTIALNEWTHIMGVYDGSTMKVYINGEEDNSKSVSGSYDNNSSHDLLMMASLNTAATGLQYYVDARIDEVQIWNKALTQTEIRDNMCKPLVGNEASLVGYWNMNEGSGSTVSDLTTNGNDGTLN